MAFDIDKITGLLSIVGQIKTALDKADDAKVRVLLTSFQEMATDAKLDAISAKEENVKLREELVKLKERLGKQQTLIQNAEGLYYSEANPKIIFCPKCYESDNKTITLHRKTQHRGGIATNTSSVSFGQDAWLECPECKNKYSQHHESD